MLSKVGGVVLEDELVDVESSAIVVYDEFASSLGGNSELLLTSPSTARSLSSSDLIVDMLRSRRKALVPNDRLLTTIQ